MSSPEVLEFIQSQLLRSDVCGREVLEVGALDVNGSTRRDVSSLSPKRYIGVDIEKGPGVDEVCAAETLVERFGEGAFDVVLSMEMLEHVRDWRIVISNLKRVLKPGGMLAITTRAKGFYYHGYPHDFWRYDVEDMRNIFSDFEIDYLEPDPSQPGVFLKARKPVEFQERKLDDFELYSIIKRRRVREIMGRDERVFALEYAVRKRLKAVIPRQHRWRLDVR